MYLIKGNTIIQAQGKKRKNCTNVNRDVRLTFNHMFWRGCIFLMKEEQK